MTAILITRASLAASAADRWREQFGSVWAIRVTGGRLWNGTGTRDVYDRLVALGPTPNPDDVDRVTGGGGWTSTPRCNQCGASGGASPRVRVGEPPEFESNTACLCIDCARAAVRAFAGVVSVTVANARLSFDDADGVTAESVDLIPVKIGDIL